MEFLQLNNIFVMVCSDRNCGNSDVCCCVLNVLHGATDLPPHRSVIRPGFCSGSGGSDCPAKSGACTTIGVNNKINVICLI